MFEVTKLNKYSYYITNRIRQCLHSDGRVFGTAEYWPTRVAAEAILAKYPDAAPPVAERDWKHGDVFETTLSVHIMVYLVVDKKPMAFAVDSNSIVGPACNLPDCLQDAKFLFNISAVVSDVAKERQASNDAESGDDNRNNTNWNRVDMSDELEILNDDDMREYVEWAKDRRFCNSGMHICDRLANQFELALKHLATKEPQTKPEPTDPPRPLDGIHEFG